MDWISVDGRSGEVKYYLTLIYQMVNLYLTIKAVRISLRLLGGFPSKKMEGDETGGHSSVGRVQASQAWCRGFEPRCPLQVGFAEEWPDSLFEVISRMPLGG
jgi:hypothetical protein